MARKHQITMLNNIINVECLVSDGIDYSQAVDMVFCYHYGFDVIVEGEASEGYFDCHFLIGQRKFPLHAICGCYLYGYDKATNSFKF